LGLVRFFHCIPTILLRLHIPLPIFFFFNVNDVRILGLLALIVPHLKLTLSPTTTTSPPSPIPNISTGESRLLAIFTALNTVAFLLIFFLVPETAGATLGSSTTGLNYISLEELSYIFSVRTRDHVSYQIRVMVPWAWEMVRWKVRGWLGRKEERPEEAYQISEWVLAEAVDG
jgi:hypothetical protein